jgi:hypothetical protein
MTKHKIVDITCGKSLTEISKHNLTDFLNLTNSDILSKCDDTKTSNSSKKHSKKHHNSKRMSKNKRKQKSTYTTTNGHCSSEKCSNTASSLDTSGLFPSISYTSKSSTCIPSSSSTHKSCSTSTNKCSSSTVSCSNKCSSSSATCRTTCSPYALKCNTYKSLGGTMLIPGPQGPSSGSLANLSGINNDGDDTLYIYFNSANLNYVNITPGTINNEYDKFTICLSGKYLFQYNIYILEEIDTTIQFVGLVSGVFGKQAIQTSGSYGCSIIQDLTAGDYISLITTEQASSAKWSFASLTIIKL